mgnify:CR=1 FL=1
MPFTLFIYHNVLSRWNQNTQSPSCYLDFPPVYLNWQGAVVGFINYSLLRQTEAEKGGDGWNEESQLIDLS